ncbi:MAG: hypothetical protein JJ896_11910 [Rhodothermales bacterium]|nr:hypothetical protein [Rhodothermales bacterium]
MAISLLSGAPSAQAQDKSDVERRTVERLTPRSFFNLGALSLHRTTGKPWNANEQDIADVWIREKLTFEAYLSTAVDWDMSGIPRSIGIGGRFFGVLAMRTHIRMLEELGSIQVDSRPVRSPSYNPGGYVMYFPRTNLGAGGGYFHYSNGQEGQTFHPNCGLDTSGAFCVEEGFFNTSDGNFSTNYAYLVVAWTRGPRLFTIEGFHYTSTDALQAPHWPKRRLAVSAYFDTKDIAGKVLGSHSKITATLSSQPSRGDRQAGVELFHGLFGHEKLGGAEIGVHVYYGYDTYNLRFKARRFSAGIGLSVPMHSRQNES